MPLISLQGVSLEFAHRACFSDIHVRIEHGARIGIVGNNGSGKTSLLKLLAGLYAPSEGRVQRLHSMTHAYVPQVLEADISMSGGERMQAALASALTREPELLLLDEPTNHLDDKHREQLLRRLQRFPGSLVMVTHDVSFMDALCDHIWHLDQGQLRTARGTYSDYLEAIEHQRSALEAELQQIQRAERATHAALMQEQERAAKARQRGIKAIEQNRWAVIKSPTKLGRGNSTAGNNSAHLRAERTANIEQRARLGHIELIQPEFHLPSARVDDTNILQITTASVRYTHSNTNVLSELDLVLSAGERVALLGPNGCGKSTLVRAILQSQHIQRDGNWLVPRSAEIGYLDQHYADLDRQISVLECLRQRVPDWNATKLQHHLADFLFRGQTVQAKVSTLSGGEMARLALARIAARAPRLLILDEITNNLDLRTRSHVEQILRHYPGALLVITHDARLLETIGVDTCWKIQNSKVLVSVKPSVAIGRRRSTANPHPD